MTQEEKQLLMKDLCARLPYGVMVDRLGVPHKVLSIKTDSIEIDRGEYMPAPYYLDEIKPYLRPMSSMTEEEAEQIIKFICKDSISINKIDVRQDRINAKVDYLIGDPETITVWFDDIIQSIEIFDFLNASYFDYRGLIPMNLALPAPEWMYN